MGLRFLVGRRFWFCIVYISSCHEEKYGERGALVADDLEFTYVSNYVSIYIYRYIP